MNAISVLDRTPVHTPRTSPIGASAVLEGLSAKQKFLPSWLFYDAEGSRLFEAITRLPEYYLTSVEHSIFLEHSMEMIAAASGIAKEPLSIVELGAGSASKTIVLLRALAANQSRTVYLPVDVSEAALEWASKNVHAALPTIDVQPICAEITREQQLSLPEEGKRLALYIGSSIGNFSSKEATDILGWLRSQLQPGDSLLLGTDMVKDPTPLLAAYNDTSGVTAAFNKNVLARLNRELAANFALDKFKHRAIWNAEASRMEMHLDSLQDQTVHIAALNRNFHFKRGESIHTENSHKFTPGTVEEILAQSGFVQKQSWYDANQWFGVHLAYVVDREAMPDSEAEEAAA